MKLVKNNDKKPLKKGKARGKECSLSPVPGLADTNMEGEVEPSVEEPEKSRLLHKLQDGKFKVPDFIFVPAMDFDNQDFDQLKSFLEKHQESFKVIARSAHPQEEFYKGGTFDSLETYADVGGILYARKRIIKSARTAKRLSILRQQRFSNAPKLDLSQMGIIVMPFVYGTSVMAKQVGDQWEFGYCPDIRRKIRSEPFITSTPHDSRLLRMSQDIQDFLGFRCEIEFIVSELGEIYVVQAKDISAFDMWELEEHQRSVKLDGIRRIRLRRNYRERPLFVMDNVRFYLDLISLCEDLILGCQGASPTIDDIVLLVNGYESEMEEFSLRNAHYAVLGLSIRETKDLYQVATRYLEDLPDMQEKLAAALHTNLYRMDYFLSEADTLIARDRFRVNLCSHDAYGVDTLRNPLWSLYWDHERHDKVVREFRRLHFHTGDIAGIDINPDDRPTVYKL